MYISELNKDTPTINDPILNGDLEIREIKKAIKTTFPNFVSGPLVYSPIELNAMYNYLSADNTNLLWTEIISINDSFYVIAIDENNFLYARYPKGMFGTIIYSQLSQAQMDLIYPNTYKLCDGINQVTNQLVNKVLDMDIITTPNLKNNYIRGIGGVAYGITLLSLVTERIKIKTESLKYKYDKLNLYIESASHDHGYGTNAVFPYSVGGTHDIITPDVTANELDIASTTNNPSPIQDPHTHTFPTTTISSQTVIPTSINTKIRPKTYNLYPYIRIN